MDFSLRFFIRTLQPEEYLIYKGEKCMFIREPYNASLLSIIAKSKSISYEDLKAEYCVPSPPGIILSVNVMFDSDLALLESEGYIQRSGNLITYIAR